jgi:hypothetical protein
MERRRIKRVPVMDGDALVGIVSRADLLRAFALVVWAHSSRPLSATQPASGCVRVSAPLVVMAAQVGVNGNRYCWPYARHLDPMANGAPNTERGEPETSSDALLDELVRALARQIAERD